MKVAFCFPGPGVAGGRHGTSVRRDASRSRRGLRGSEARLGPRSRASVLRGPARGADRDGDPAAGARSRPRLRVCAQSRRAVCDPTFVVGHSVGEYSALGGLRGAVAERCGRPRDRARQGDGRRRRASTPGAMAAVLGLDDAVVEELCAEIEDVWPANYNCPGQIVVSGGDDAVDRLIARRPSAGPVGRCKLAVTGAFHSPLVGSAAEAPRPARRGDLEPSEPRVPFMSTVTARFEGRERSRRACWSSS